MTIERGTTRNASPPLHVHVDKATPVHVHVKKTGKKSSTASAVEDRLKSTKSQLGRYSSGNVRPSSSRGPWVPAPGRSTKAKPLAWESSSHRLELGAPEQDTVYSTLRVEDLDSEVEEDKYRLYEKKIDSLMSEVGQMKTERELQKTKREASRAREELLLSKKLLEDQEEEILDYKQELHTTERQSKTLQETMERMEDEINLSRTEHNVSRSERDRLMKQLVEVEMDAGAAVKQMNELRRTVHRLKEEKRMSSHDGKILTKQRDLLLDKLNDFENTNRVLRKMLRDHHRNEASREQVDVQRDVLLKKLTESDATNQKLRLSILDKEHEVESLKAMLAAEKGQTNTMQDLQSSLESTRAHLQNQLRKREADCNRMAVQIRNIENQLEQEKIEVEHLQGLLSGAKEKAIADKEALKKATRIQKQRASRSEDAVDQLNSQVLEREAQIADSVAVIEQWKAKASKFEREKLQIVHENELLSQRVEGLQGSLRETEVAGRSTHDNMSLQIASKTAEVTSLKLDNERLKVTLATIEDKLKFSNSEIDQLKSTVGQYESLMSDQKTRMSKSQREAADANLRLEREEREKSRILDESHSEIERVRSRLEQQLDDLQPLPEMLRSSEQRLLAATERLTAQEKRSSEQTQLINDITLKMDQQREQLEAMRDKWHQAQDECRTLRSQIEPLERKSHEFEVENRDMHGLLSKREETLRQNQLEVEDKNRELASLTRQLEQSIADNRRIEEESREKSIARERNWHARILELESQLSRSKTEAVQLRRGKEEGERKFNSRLHDLKDRLEQSHSTNRSMQNYVQFLKSSYSNVFGDTSLASSPYRPRSPIHT
ncbi:outer dense fiber protein 2-like isoform X2 [Antedon mediterranea]|uniref:outer dense fiber protein 2-like isoform X2 n=1 Tax=Antedon mediterranea TaxID=105859 RepID=UPI003AF99638